MRGNQLQSVTNTTVTQTVVHWVKLLTQDLIKLRVVILLYATQYGIHILHCLFVLPLHFNPLGTQAALRRRNTAKTTQKSKQKPNINLDFAERSLTG
jgi:hypothetical protein